jgi:large subunit ribosomal protein L21
MSESTSIKFAIVEIGGLQYKVTPGQKLQVPKINVEAGEKISFTKESIKLVCESSVTGESSENDKIWSSNEKGSLIEKISIETSVTRHLNGDKLIIFKKKRRKNHDKKTGYRQKWSELHIEGFAIS